MGALVRTTATQAPVVQKEGAQYLTFLLGSEMFAIDILGIKEIIEYGSLTSVPMMPEFIRGVINLRGRVVPVIDLTMRFGRVSIGITKWTCIVILEVVRNDRQQYLGVMVDAVTAVVDIPDADIEPPPQFGAQRSSDFISGIGKTGGQFVIILDMHHVLSVEELAKLEGVGE